MVRNHSFIQMGQVLLTADLRTVRREKLVISCDGITTRLNVFRPESSTDMLSLGVMFGIL